MATKVMAMKTLTEKQSTTKPPIIGCDRVTGFLRLSRCYSGLELQLVLVICEVGKFTRKKAVLTSPEMIQHISNTKCNSGRPKYGSSAFAAVLAVCLLILSSAWTPVCSALELVRSGAAVTDEQTAGQANIDRLDESQTDDAQLRANMEAAAASANKISGELPEGEQGVGVEENTGVDLPLDLTFTDDQGSFRRLGDFFDGERPVMLSLNYSDCPMLCSVQWQNMTNTLKDISFQPGRDFEIVSISIDPNESVKRAKDTKERYLAAYNLPETKDGWHFMVGTAPNIKKLADTIGFQYKRLPNGHYSHPPLFVLCSPGGRVVRYVHGLKVEPQLLDKALIESAEGKIGSPINQFVYACFQYNTVTGQYTLSALFLMKLGGVATVIVLLSMLVPYWFVSRFAKSPSDLADSQLIELT